MFSIRVESFYSIQEVKLRIENKGRISFYRQRLFHFGKILDDRYTLKDYEIGNRNNFLELEILTKRKKMSRSEKLRRKRGNYLGIGEGSFQLVKKGRMLRLKGGGNGENSNTIEISSFSVFSEASRLFFHDRGKVGNVDGGDSTMIGVVLYRFDGKTSWVSSNGVSCEGAYVIFKSMEELKKGYASYREAKGKVDMFTWMVRCYASVFGRDPADEGTVHFFPFSLRSNRMAKKRGGDYRSGFYFSERALYVFTFYV